MDDLTWLNHPAMKNIDPKKLAILVEFIGQTENKSMEQLVSLLVNTNKKMKAQDLSFTENENDLLIEILTKNMSPQDKKKFELIKKMTKK